MVNQETTKIGVGAVAVAGTLFVAYVLYKQWKKRANDSNETNGDTVGRSWSEVRRRPGNRGRNGRNGRNGRHVSDPGRMFYSTDKVMPVPSDTTKEGIYKRRSTSGISQIPKPMGTKTEEKTDEPKREQLDVSVSEPESPVSLGKDERYEDAIEKKKAKKESKSPRPKSPIPPAEGSQIPVKSEKSKDQPLPKTSIQRDQEQPSKQTSQQKESEVKVVKAEAIGSLSSQSAEVSNEGGAGEEMAVPVDPHLLEDQSAMMIGDSEGSDIGAGDALAEDIQFASKAGITLSPVSSVESSPAKSPAVVSSQQSSLNPVPVEESPSQAVSSQQNRSDPVPKEEPNSQPVQSDEASSKAANLEQTSEEPEMKLDPELITRVILQVQKSPNSLDTKVIKILVDLLKVKEERLLQTALESVVRCAAFSANQRVLRENGCPEELCRLLQTYSETVVSGTAGSDNILVSINNAVMNLSMDVANQAKLQACIPLLIDLVMHEGLSSNVKLSSLQPLTNLATTSSYHGQYTRAVQQLYDLLDAGNRLIRIQALKLLVNLSCNSDMVKHLLAAKAPSCLLSLLEKTADPHLSLRMVTFLANIASTVQKEEVTSSSLPPDDKAASPETMYSAIFGVNTLTQIRSKVYPLTRHDSEDISQQAAKLYSSLPNC